MRTTSGQFQSSGPGDTAGTIPGGRFNATARWKTILLGCILLGLAAPASPVLADPWKDRGGHGRHGRHDERRWNHDRDREEHRRWAAERRRERKREGRWAWEQEQRQHWAGTREAARPARMARVPVPVPAVPAPVPPAPASPEAPRRAWQ
ncbi:hypothetical protein [Roseomonas chloroacetimidivorans]|uniref:hypothetical protein n=1 Tax=Roseomonas chloroacetimidivorans TaxID=1766656 RepID=UPI003C71940E